MPKVSQTIATNEPSRNLTNPRGETNRPCQKLTKPWRKNHQTTPQINQTMAKGEPDKAGSKQDYINNYTRRG